MDLIVQARSRSVRWLVLLTLIFSFALLVRLCAVSLFPSVPVADAADYHRLASGLIEGRGYAAEGGALTAWRPPGYPAFLFAVYSLWGINVNAVFYAQAVVGAATVVLLIIFGSQTIGRPYALSGGAIAAVYPGLFWLSRVLLSENLSLLLILAALCLAAWLTKHYSWWVALTLGAVLGAAALVRGANLMIGALVITGLAVFWWRKGLPRLGQAARLALILAGVCAVMAPWAVRNYAVFGRFVPLATQEGIGLYASYWPPVSGAKRVWGNLPGKEDREVALAYSLNDEVETSRRLQSLVWRRLLQEPSHFFKLWPPKIISMAAPFDWEWFPHRPGRTRSWNFGYLLLLLPSMAGATVLLRQPLERVWLLAVLPVAVLIQTLVFYGSPRFRLPAELIVILLAPVGIDWAVRRFAESRWQKRAGGAAN